MELLCDIIYDIDSRIDVAGVLESARHVENNDYSDNLSVEEYFNNIDTAIEYYEEYEPQLEYILDGSQPYFFGWFVAAIVTVVSVYFIAKAAEEIVEEHLLTTELLLHAAFNNVVDSVYYPVHISEIPNSKTFKGILNASDTEGSTEFTTADDGEDLFLALHGVSYSKTQNNSVVELYDRFDFDFDAKFDPWQFDFANKMAAVLQKVDVLTPFQIIIDFEPNKGSSNSSVQTNYLVHLDVDGYTEEVVALGRRDKYNISLDFWHEGRYVIQTFGDKETVLKLYKNGGLVNEYRGGGFGKNSLLCCDVDYHDSYMVSVEFNDWDTVGATKLAITQYSDGIDKNSATYYSFYPISASYFVLDFQSTFWYADVNILYPTIDGYHSFNLIDDNQDLFVYVIDPRSPRRTQENGDPTLPSVSGYKSINKKVLTKEIPYFIVVSQKYGEPNYDKYLLSCNNVLPWDNY